MSLKLETLLLPKQNAKYKSVTPKNMTKRTPEEIRADLRRRYHARKNNETPEEREERKLYERMKYEQMLANETPEEREERRRKARERYRRIVANETPEEKEARLQKVRVYQREYYQRKKREREKMEKRLSKPFQIRLEQKTADQLEELVSAIKADSPRQATVNQSAILRECVRIGLHQIKQEREKNDG